MFSAKWWRFCSCLKHFAVLEFNPWLILLRYTRHLLFKVTQTGPWFNIKMSSYQYRKSHCGEKTVVRLSYLHNGISCTGKMSSLYWIMAQDTTILFSPFITQFSPKYSQYTPHSLPWGWYGVYFKSKSDGHALKFLSQSLVCCLQYTFVHFAGLFVLWYSLCTWNNIFLWNW